jgi:hypothetical protein
MQGALRAIRFAREAGWLFIKVAGVDPEGEIRIVELSNHRFFLAPCLCRGFPQALTCLTH